MAEEHFSWLPEESPVRTKLDVADSKAKPNAEKKTFRRLLLDKIYEHKAGLAVVFGLLAVIVGIKISQGDAPPQFSRLEAMSAPLPLPKGKVLEAMLLRPTLISPAAISKAQRFDLLRPEDAEKLMGKIRAKKDIPPNKPIFWTELELLPEEKVPIKSVAPTIIYSEENK